MSIRIRAFLLVAIVAIVVRQWSLLDADALSSKGGPEMSFPGDGGLKDHFYRARNLTSKRDYAISKMDRIGRRQNRSTVFELLSTRNRASASPVKDLLRVYVYDNLPHEFDADIVDFLMNHYTNTSINSETDCKAELALIELFRTFPGRTMNPDEADIFVVPYAHASHCFMNPPGQVGCRQLSSDLIGRLIDSLPYYQTHKSRHMFLLGYELGLLNKQLSQQDLILTSGPRDEDHSQPGAIIIPLFNDAPRFQPSVIVNRSLNWWTRPRKYAFGYFYGESNMKTRAKFNGRRFRKYFRLDMEAQHETNEVGGLPFRLHRLDSMDSNWKVSGTEAVESYAESVFCPILAGDAPWQRRFFDAILSGCLPVVLTWTTPSYPGGKSWFQPEYKVYGTKKKKSNRRKTYSIQQAYPFAKGLFGDDDSDDIAIDYDAFVIECPGNQENETDVSSLRLTMEDLLLNRPDEIRRRQLEMQRVAVSFSYGLGEDAHRYEDAFSRIIRTLKYRLSSTAVPPA